MKPLVTIVAFFFGTIGNAQNFGEFASALRLERCGSITTFNLTGSGANCINPSCGTVFQGTNLGVFNQNSGGIRMKGGELKTWKNGGANVCGANIMYTCYLTGFRPASPVFTPMNLPFKANCSSGTFTDGFGPCGGNDQKWGTSSNSIDLSTLSLGNNTIEIYIQYFGDDFSTSGCGTNRFISNGGFNYTATFTLVASGASCTSTLPVELTEFNSTCVNGQSEVNWVTVSENNSAYFDLLGSTDGESWTHLARKTAAINSTSEIHYAHQIANSWNYFKLIQVDLDGQKEEFGPISSDCSTENSMFCYFNEDEKLIVNLNHTRKDSQGVIDIFDLNGKLIHHIECETNQSSTIVEINSPFESGIYLVRYMDSSANSMLLTKAFIHR
ncbi:MAG: hypothetical protein RI922_186 [Bacteroidota bacterium]|jgi:hypothetical protein